MIWAALALLLAAGVALWWASRQQKESGLPSGRIIYSDTTGWGRVEKPLYDETIKLAGKPDYLVEDGGFILPVEVKSGWAPSAPYPGHLYQLAAYCQLVEKTYGRTPPYGIIKYRNRTFAIDFTPGLQSGLLGLLSEIRKDEKRTQVDRSHDDPARCKNCGYRDVCNQKLN
jgi:CRISPR-associated exonuclease Cas4